MFGDDVVIFSDKHIKFQNEKIYPWPGPVGTEVSNSMHTVTGARYFKGDRHTQLVTRLVKRLGILPPFRFIEISGEKNLYGKIRTSLK